MSFRGFGIFVIRAEIGRRKSRGGRFTLLPIVNIVNQREKVEGQLFEDYHNVDGDYRAVKNQIVPQKHIYKNRNEIIPGFIGDYECKASHTMRYHSKADKK